MGEIIEHTLGRYWNARSEKRIAVHWRDGRATAPRATSAEEIWYGNKYLNVFAREGVPEESYEALRLEYGRSPAAWKRLPQDLYVRAATSKRSGKFLSQVGFSCIPESGETQDTVVLGGNHRLRLLHPESGRTTVLLKNGFPSRFIEEEIKLRTRLAPSLAPRLLTIDLAGGSLQEEYRPGTPVNRLADGGESLVPGILERLKDELVMPGWKETDKGEWLDDRVSRLRAQIASRGWPVIDGKTPVGEAVGAIEAAAHRLGYHELRVPVSDTHGDLQPGNILSATGRAWLIDWECCGTRFAGYDWLTFGTQIRLEPSLVRACSRIGDANAECWRILPSGWCGLPGFTTQRALWAFAWLLEELLFAFEEREGLTGAVNDEELSALLSGVGPALQEIGRLR